RPRRRPHTSRGRLPRGRARRAPSSRSVLADLPDGGARVARPPGAASDHGDRRGVRSPCRRRTLCRDRDRRADRIGRGPAVRGRHAVPHGRHLRRGHPVRNAARARRARHTDTMTLVTIVKKSSYQDSVVLLALARELRGSPGVGEAAALMATDANKALMDQSGLLTAEARSAGPNDLVIVIRAATPQEAEVGRGRAEEVLTRRQERVGAQARGLPRAPGAPRPPPTGADPAAALVP